MPTVFKDGNQERRAANSENLIDIALKNLIKKRLLKRVYVIFENQKTSHASNRDGYSFNGTHKS